MKNNKYVLTFRNVKIPYIEKINNPKSLFNYMNDSSSFIITTEDLKFLNINIKDIKNIISLSNKLKDVNSKLTNLSNVYNNFDIDKSNKYSSIKNYILNCKDSLIKINNKYIEKYFDKEIVNKMEDYIEKIDLPNFIKIILSDIFYLHNIINSFDTYTKENRVSSLYINLDIIIFNIYSNNFLLMKDIKNINNMLKLYPFLNSNITEPILNYIHKLTIYLLISTKNYQDIAYNTHIKNKQSELLNQYNKKLRKVLKDISQNNIIKNKKDIFNKCKHLEYIDSETFNFINNLIE